MGASADRAARIATFVLMALAYTACEIASYPDGNMRPFGVAFGACLFVLAILGSYLIPVPSKGQSRPPAKWAIGFAVALLLPLLIEPLLREWTGNGFPLDLQMVNGLRILGLSLCAASAWTVCRRTAGVVAMFLALFSSAMGDQPQIPFVLVPFALMGGIWLILSYRSEQSNATDAVADGRVTHVPMRLPFREAIVFGILAAISVGVAVAGPKRILLTLGELMPTSGGTGNVDPFARYGIGDGPEEVAGDNARAAGMVETDKMIEDNKNSLIDAVNDMYGPPHKPNKDQERMVAAGLSEVIEQHGKLPDNRRPSRDFDTSRKGPKSDKTPDSQKARGVLEVEGRTPLHIRIVAYERYRSDEKRWEEAKKPGSRHLDAEGGDWMKLTNLRETDWYANDDRHRIKVANLTENLVPTPSHLTRFRINKVDKPDYYEWDYDGVLALQGRKKTPPGVVVTTECRTLDPAHLQAKSFAPAKVPINPEIPDAINIKLTQLSQEWAGSFPRGWMQIDAILSKLRSDYSLDPNVTVPPDHPAPVLWFLTESRRGPDYLFATSAALMLRSLGYSSRVCLGYYAAPEAYDSETAHTPVKTSDLHVWPEILLNNNHWLVVEPTPGYQTLPRLKPWRERLLDALTAALSWLKQNIIAVILAVGLFAILVVKWRFLWDWSHTMILKLFPGQTWQEQSLRTMKLLDRRTRLAGRPRPESSTLSGWFRQFRESEELQHFVKLTEWAAYGSNLSPPVPESTVTTVCQTVLREWPLSRFQRSISESRTP
jgi:hypothetical protein